MRFKSSDKFEVKREMRMVLATLKILNKPKVTAAEIAARLLWKTKRVEVRLRWLCVDGELIAERGPPFRRGYGTTYYRLPEKDEYQKLVCPFTQNVTEQTK